jgi:hypothetical protein
MVLFRKMTSHQSLNDAVLVLLSSDNEVGDCGFETGVRLVPTAIWIFWSEVRSSTGTSDGWRVKP